MSHQDEFRGEGREPKEGPASPSRRQALKSAAGAGLLLLLPMLPAYAEAAGTWTAVGKASQFPLHQPQRVGLKGGGVLWVTRQTATALTAVSAKCTHRGCEVGWTAADKKFECPCHGAQFAADGKNLQGTRRNPQEHLPNLPSVPVRQKGAQVAVNLSHIAPETLQPGMPGGGPGGMPGGPGGPGMPPPGVPGSPGMPGGPR